MKKTILALVCACFTLASCDKKTSTPPVIPQPQTTSNTNDLGRTWKVYMYDSTNLNANPSPGEADFKATSTSSSGGTGIFETRFNGVAADSEIVTYTLSNNNQNVVFIKTGGNASRLSGGGTWSIQFLSADSVRMSCSSNRCLKMR